MLSDNQAEQSPKNQFGSPFFVILTTIIIFFLSQFVAFGLVEIGYSILKHQTFSGLESATTNSIASQFFYVLIAESLAALLAIALVRRKKLGLSAIGLGRRPITSDFIRASAGFAIFFGILILVSFVLNAFPGLSKEKQDLGFNHLQTGLEQTLAFISLVILPPLGEETLVRGYLYSGLRQAWRFTPALVVTSLFFGIAHLEFGSGNPLVWAAAIDTFLLSIVLVYLREKTGALYAGMLVHMLNNLIAFFVVVK